MEPPWTTEGERIAHHVGNLFGGTVIALALLWAAAWGASYEWTPPVPMEIMRWVTVVALIGAAAFFALFAWAAAYNLTLTAGEERQRIQGYDTPPPR